MIWRQWIFKNEAWKECSFKEFVEFPGKSLEVLIEGMRYTAIFFPGRESGEKNCTIRNKFEHGLLGIDLVEYFLSKFSK